MVPPYRRECGAGHVTAARYVHQGLTEKYGLTVACSHCGEQAALPRPGLEPEVAHRRDVSVVVGRPNRRPQPSVVGRCRRAPGRAASANQSYR